VSTVPDLGAEFCYLTTLGRRSGRPHTIEIWFAERDGVVYLLSGRGDRADWVRNLVARPRVTLRFGGPRSTGPELPGEVVATARVVTDPAEDALARELLAAKYQRWGPGAPLSEWASTALPVAVATAP
jgi:deazaflavin-dependent oxidoreductase (nitroreductase family)